MNSNLVLYQSESLSSSSSPTYRSVVAYHKMKAKMRCLSGSNIVDQMDTNKNHAISSEAHPLQNKRVPDILMINKYYGLIPQKFTISSRNTQSTPSSANGNSSRRTSTKPRAKSSTHQRSTGTVDGKGHRSENDSPDPIQMILGARRVSLEFITTEKADSFGPVSRKMAVEKYKKWKCSNGGKGFRRGGSLCLNGDVPTVRKRNNGNEIEYLGNNKPVLKIDLNTVSSSWDEENLCERTGIQTINATKSEANPFSPGMGNELNEDRVIMCLVNNAINNNDKWRDVPCKQDENEDRQEVKSSSIESIKESASIEELSPGKISCVLDPSNDKEVEAARKCSDGKSLMKMSQEDNGDGDSTSNKSESTKRRPTTANSKSTYRTPNTFNPPSKVIPWTQRESAGGRPLTLAERRAKFQRAPSIHSSSSVSMDCGEEEQLISEEIEVGIRIPSTAYRESRKPLHVTQPPEIATLVSQNNPNADEDIQIEIEKVAIMLRKTQSLKHFSRSLDSGIELERGTEDVKILHVEPKAVDCDIGRSASESSLTDSDSSDSCGEGEGKAKCKSCPVPSQEKLEKGLSEKDKGKKTAGNDGQINRQCSSNVGNPRPSLKQNVMEPSTIRRPPLRKAVSISCESELLKAAAKGNEVNSCIVNEKNIGRPRTAQVRSPRENSGGVGTRSTQTNNYSHQRNANNGSCSNIESHQNGGNQGSRNRKILIKKALMEINQSRDTLRKKWGTLGRPRTAPSSEKNVSRNNQHPQPQSIAQEKRKPMKASPFPISSGGRMGPSISGKSNVSMVASKSASVKSRENSMEPRASSEAPEEETNNQQKGEVENEENALKRGQRSPFRQSFSLDEGALLGFSKKSVGEGRMPIFERMSEEGINQLRDSGDMSRPISLSILNDEVSFLSSQKREQCLKVYEKMMKTGCHIKLDTIFRGMLTPSEYRAFMRAAEKAADEEEEDDEDDKEDENEEVSGEITDK